MANNNGNGKSLESYIWDAACRLFHGMNTLLIIPGKLSIMRSSKRDALRFVTRCPIYRP